MSGSGDWRDSAFVDRERAVDEIHLRASHPVRPYARISHMVRVMRSPSDFFREELFQRFWEAEARRTGTRPTDEEAPPAVWLTPSADTADRPRKEIDADIHKRRLAAQARQNVTKDAMRALRSQPSRGNRVLRAFAHTKRRNLSQAHKVLINVFKDTMGMVDSPERYANSLAGQTQAALEEVGKLVRLYAPKGPLDPESATIARDEADPDDDGREPFERLSPFAPGGEIDPAAPFSARRVWLNIWRRDTSQTPHPPQSDRLRLHWELYDANHNFTAYEDFHCAEEASEAGLFVASDSARVDTDRTAFSAVNAAITTLTQGGAFGWQGELFALSHFYVLPLRDVAAARLGAQEAEQLMAALEPDAEIPAAATATLRSLLSQEAQKYFHFPDKTRATGLREDFVITRVAGGAAVMVSDLRPHSRTEYHLERAARTLIFDIALTEESRGRLMKTCIELATYRMLGVRSYANLFPARELFNDLAEEISERTFGLTKGVNYPYYSSHKRLRELDLISARLDAANFFITDGVNGAAGQAMNYSRLVRDRLARLDERPIAGFQSAEDIFGRFISSTLNTKRFAERYEQVRRRVTEANELLRADMDLGLQAIIGVLGGTALVLSIDSLWGSTVGPALTAALAVLVIFCVAALARHLSKKKRPPDRSGGRS